MTHLTDKNIILGITGGIAAYKAAELCRRLVERGARVRVVMTAAAQEFISPLTLQALSGRPVADNLFDIAAEAAMGHIELARWADLILVAPASADFISRLAHGAADDLLTTLCLATNAPIMVAPAMNQQMWLNPITQANLERLAEYDITIIKPGVGSQACGDIGPGRLPEPAELLAELEQFFQPKILTGTRVLITAGPTQEAIDPVRYLSNRSSGKMGFALAAAAQASGAEVQLIAGPVKLATPLGVKRHDVTSAEQMAAAVMQAITEADIFIAAAAVADYRCVTPATEKIKKSSDHLMLELVRNPDILALVAELPNPPLLVGFAAETNNIIDHARTKLANKKLDIIVANKVGTSDTGFDTDTNELTVLWNNGEQHLPLASKQQLAYDLITLIANYYYAKNSA